MLTEVGGFRPFLRERLIVELSRRSGIEREVELVFPTKLEARFAHGIVAVLGARVAFGEVSRVGGQLVGDDAGFDVVFVR